MRSLKIKTSIIIVISIIIILITGTVWFSLSTISRLRDNLSMQVQARSFVVALKDNLTSMLNAETGERGFVISGDSSYLEPYKMALVDIPENLSNLNKLSTDSNQVHNTAELQKAIQLKLTFIDQIITLKQQGNEVAVKKLLIEGRGKTYMDNIRKINKRMQDISEKKFAERQTATAESISVARIVFITEAFFAMLITLFLATMILTELNKRYKSENNLLQANIELSQKNKEIEQFAYVASHDLQEPLRSISNFSSLLATKIESTADPSIKKYIDTILHGTKRMSKLIFDLLDYSRIGKGSDKIRIDCNNLLNEVLADMNATIKETHSVIHVGKLPIINGFSYLKSLFMNLLGNAIKFHKPESRPEVSISATETNREYLFEIRDNGIGIDREYNERIFVIFQRLHTRSEYAGTGIGLAQCKKIVELHGGKIWVESEPGKGSTFKFTIPKS